MKTIEDIYETFNIFYICSQCIERIQINQYIYISTYLNINNAFNNDLILIFLSINQQ